MLPWELMEMLFLKYFISVNVYFNSVAIFFVKVSYNNPGLYSPFIVFLRTSSKFVFFAATVETASLALTTRVIRESTVTTWGTMTPRWRENKSRRKVVREQEINTLEHISLNEFKFAYKASHTVHIHHSASILAHPVR